MRINRKSVTIGLLGLGLIGAVAAGGVATAATTTPDRTATVAGGSCFGDGQLGDQAMGGGMTAPFTAAAQYLGLSPADLQTRLQSGSSLAAVAAAQGRSVTGLENAMVAAAKAELDTDTRLSAPQRTARLALMRSEITIMITTARVGDDTGVMGGGMAGAGMDSARMGGGGDGTGMGGGMGM